MYEVWFMDCYGYFHLEETFESFEEASAYIAENKEYLSYEEDMCIKKIN